MRNAQQLSSCWLHCAPPRLSGEVQGAAAGEGKVRAQPSQFSVAPGGSYTCK